MNSTLSPDELTPLQGFFASARDIARFVGCRMREERLAQVAASLTYTTTLSLVPLVTIILAVFTALPVFGHIEDSLHTFLLRNLMPVNISDSIFHYLNQFAVKARGLTLVGLFFLTVTAVATMLTVDRALNKIWHVRRARPLYQRILVYWAALTIGPILLGLSMTLTSYLATASVGFVKRPTLAVAILIDLVPLLLLTFAYAALYVYVPNRRVQWRDALIGGFCGALGFEISKRIFAIYVARFPTYTAIYGALAALPLFLLWVYLSWLITLIGATIAASLPELYQRRWTRAWIPGQDFADALIVLRALYRARSDSMPGRRVAALSSETHLNPDQLEALLEKMESDGLVIRTRPVSRGTATTWPEEIWMFAADAMQIDLERVFRLFAFDGPLLARTGIAVRDPLASTIERSPGEILKTTLADAFAVRA